MMTKKDYIRAAEICRLDYAGDRKVMYAFIDLFHGDNPNFDAERFAQACEPKDDKRRRR